MTDLDRLKETFAALGVPFIEDSNKSGDIWVSLEAHNFGGYSGFQTVFAFDPDGKFNLKGGGIWE